MAWSRVWAIQKPYPSLYIESFLSWECRTRVKMSWWTRLPTPATARHLLYGIIIGFSISLSSTSLALYYQARKRDRLAARYDPRPIELRSDEILSGVTGLIGMHHLWLYLIVDFTGVFTGNTPLVRINSLSNALGVEILGKAEVWLFEQINGPANTGVVPEPWRKCQRSRCIAK